MKDQKIKAMIDEGDYWNALNLEANATSPEITLRVMDLLEQYSSIGRELNMVQTALTSQQDEYKNACTLRDQVLKQLSKSYGAPVSDLFKAIIWKQIWNMGMIASSETYTDHLIQEIKKSITGMQGLKITSVEAHSGEAIRALGERKKNCPRCGGTGRIKLTAQEMLAEMQSNDRFRDELFNLYRSHPSSVPQLEVESSCPACTTEIVFQVPSGVKAGWILKGKAKGKATAHYVRVSAIVEPEQPRIPSYRGAGSLANLRTSEITEPKKSKISLQTSLRIGLVVLIVLVLLGWWLGGASPEVGGIIIFCFLMIIPPAFYSISKMS